MERKRPLSRFGPHVLSPFYAESDITFLDPHLARTYLTARLADGRFLCGWKMRGWVKPIQFYSNWR